MDLTNFYYEYNGEYPENKNHIAKTNAVFEHLKDCGLTEKQIIDIIIKEFPNKEYLDFNDIPNSFWNDSLLKRDKFYYHKELQITSPPPTWDKSFPFFLEMKMSYSEEDILNYYVKVFNLREEWTSKDKEIGSIKYLLNKYKMFSFIEPVDFMLHLIDYVKSIGVKPSSIYDLCDYEIELAEYLEKDVKNAVLSNKNKIVWRS